MYQILLIPNITWQKNIDQDSYIQVISEIIGELNKIRDDLFWHSPVPCYSELINYTNVRQHYFPTIPTYPNSMRGHFDHNKWLEFVNWKNCDFDLIYSHLPEWTVNIINLLANSTNMGVVPTVGYTHWSEIKEVTKYPKTFLLNNINGLLEMKQCGINTDAQKQLLLKNVKHIYSDKTLKKLDKILTPHYLGIRKELIRKSICTKPNKTIVFNHRPQTYKNWPYFLQIMDKLWEIRKDFNVWVPLLDKPNRPYIDTTSLPKKKDYYNKLSKCLVCYCPKQHYAGWSVSGTDALMNGLPVLFYDGDYYRELMSEGDFHKTDKEALDFFIKLLDNVRLRNKKARKSLNYAKEILTWENRIKPINDMINEALDSTKPVSDKSKKINEIVDLIHKYKSITKSQILKHMGWGVGIRFNNYRKYLLMQSNIQTIMRNNQEYYISSNDTKIPFFKWKE